MANDSSVLYPPMARQSASMCELLNDQKTGIETISDSDWHELRLLAEHWVGAKGDYSQFVTSWLRSGYKADFANGTFNIQTYGDKPLVTLYPSRDAKHPHAVGIFLQFLQGSDRGNLARCERETCQRYFMPRSANHKRFCLPRCQDRKGSTIAMRKVRANKLKDQMDRVHGALREFERNAPNAEWRRYVSSATGVTLRTINSWLKRGLIQAPVTKKSRR